jgi:hypothetical protein
MLKSGYAHPWTQWTTLEFIKVLFLCVMVRPGLRVRYVTFNNVSAVSFIGEYLQQVEQNSVGRQRNLGLPIYLLNYPINVMKSEGAIWKRYNGLVKSAHHHMMHTNALLNYTSCTICAHHHKSWIFDYRLWGMCPFAFHDIYWII